MTQRLPDMNQDLSTRGAGRRWFLASVAALTLVGALLRFMGLGARDFWFDESCSFIYVHHLFDWPEESSLLVESTNLPYYAALRGWVSLFGDSEAGYRSMSALAATLVIPVLGFLALRMGGRAAGIVCAAIAAFHPLHIHYAHEARAYALWTLVLSIALWLLYEASRRADRRWWFAYGLVLLVCLHLHYFTVYWMAASAVSLCVGGDRRRVWRQWLVTTIVVGAGFLPYFLAAVWPAARGGGGVWIAKSWEPISAIPRTLWAFMPAGGYPPHLSGLSMHSPDTVDTQAAWLVAVTRTAPAIILLLVFLLLARRTVRRAPNESSDAGNGRAHVFLAGLTVLPLILAWLYSLLVRPNYLVGRYDLVAWPACVVWIGLGIAQFARMAAPSRSGWTAAAICTPLLACSLVPIARMAALKPPPTFHHVRARRLAQLTSPGDLVIAFSYDRDYLLYYLHRAGFRARIASFPSWLDAQIGWVDTEADLVRARSGALADDVTRQLERIASVIARGKQVWILADWIAHAGGSRRAAINDRLLEAVGRTGYRMETADADLLILLLRGSSHL